MLKDRPYPTKDSREAAEIYQRWQHKGLRMLSARERLILSERFTAYKTLQQVGDMLNITRERVRQLQNRAVATLRRYE